MRAQTELTESGLTITGTGELNGIDVNMHDVDELAPTIAAAATLANSPSRLRGIAHLRGHETDRLAALVTEIERLGGSARELEDGIEIFPRSNLHGARMESYEEIGRASCRERVEIAEGEVAVTAREEER